MARHGAGFLMVIWGLLAGGCVEIQQLGTPNPNSNSAVDNSMRVLAETERRDFLEQPAGDDGQNIDDGAGATDTTDDGMEPDTGIDDSGVADANIDVDGDVTVSSADDLVFAAGIPPLPPGLDVVTTASGLKYITITEGSGDPPPDDQAIIRVDWVGYLDDGTQFGGSESEKFELDKTVDGFQEALLAMNVGERRRLIIPPELGFGERDNLPNIPPNSTLIFDVTLLEIEILEVISVDDPSVSVEEVAAPGRSPRPGSN